MLTLDGKAGQEQMQLGLAAVALNNADLLILARDVAKLISAERGSCTIDDIRTHPSLHGRQPSSPNFWGGVFHETGWKCLGYEASKLRSNHARRVGRYRWQP